MFKNLILGYKKYVSQWFSVLMQKMQPHLYGNGGNIIMVQVIKQYYINRQDLIIF